LFNESEISLQPLSMHFSRLYSHLIDNSISLR
jgi:hypothetical protein